MCAESPETIEPKSQCFFCGKKAMAQHALTLSSGDYDLPFCNCERCGRYVLDWQVRNSLDKGDTAFRLACLCHERKLRGQTGLLAVFITSTARLDARLSEQLKSVWSLDEMLDDFPGATEIIDRALLNLSRFMSHPMDMPDFTYDDLQYILFCPRCDLRTMIGYMKEMGLLKEFGDTRANTSLCISPLGWQRVQDLSSVAVDSRQAFVAMWIDEHMDAILAQGIKPAVEKAGFICKRVDLKQHNNKICDEIVSEIRKSRFVIADFTGQRGGVYFEAGYALGIGLPVIWLVRKDEVESLHFDTRQYNHIVYESADDLRDKLYNRIAATIR